MEKTTQETVLKVYDLLTTKINENTFVIKNGTYNALCDLAKQLVKICLDFNLNNNFIWSVMSAVYHDICCKMYNNARKSQLCKAFNKIIYMTTEREL